MSSILRAVCVHWRVCTTGYDGLEGAITLSPLPRNVIMSFLFGVPLSLLFGFLSGFYVLCTVWGRGGKRGEKWLVGVGVLGKAKAKARAGGTREDGR